MAPKKPCFHFQLGRCNKGDRCTYGHFRDPNFKRKPCFAFARGRCNKGDDCTFSHDAEDIADSQTPPDPICEAENAAVEAKLRRWRYLSPGKAARYRTLSNSEKADYWRTTYELTQAEAGVVQEVIIWLAGEVGMDRVKEVVYQKLRGLREPDVAEIFDQQLLPFFKAITNDNVSTSAILQGRVLTICNLVYGGGDKAAGIFEAVATHLSTLRLPSAEDEATNMAVVSAFEYSLAAFAMVVQGNTPAQAHDGLRATVQCISALLEGDLSDSAAFALSNANKHLRHLKQRFKLGEAIPKMNGKQKAQGNHAFFELARELPGRLSNDGPRHDNDHDDIRSISILPTLQEIQSARNEYLPTADPREWHIGGLEGLLDRNFRLLREDTVGQLRDAAKFELERLQNPQQVENSKRPRQGARTFVYSNVEVADIAFDPHGGLEFALGFDQPNHLHNKSKAQRRDWWEGSKRLGTEALICLLSSSGGATFFVVAPEPREAKVRDAELEEIRGRLQKTYSLIDDRARGYIIARLVNPDDADKVIAQTLHQRTIQLSLAEFPGVLLPAFMPTLKALQGLSIDLNVPFSDVLAPVSTPANPDRDIDVTPPLYASRPGFRYNLSTLTSDKADLHFTPNQRMEETAQALQDRSTLDAGQADALLSSLSQSLALIQGPPGTGKSYTGMEIIRALLANGDNIDIGPILTVTFTNHALDQGLMRLLDEGVSGIIRIGGRSKSERLADVNLRMVAQRNELTKSEKQDRFNLQKETELQAKTINQRLHELGQLEGNGGHDLVEEHLQYGHPRHWQQLFGQDEDGFQRVNYGNDRTIDSWLRSGTRNAWRPRSAEELADANVHTMTGAERRALYDSWTTEIREQLLEELANSQDTFQDRKERLELIRTDCDLRVLKQAKIVGCTTSGLARHIDLLCRMKPKVLVCEEAGEVLEAHLLTALLPSVEHAILIGDHQQLRPNVQNYDLSAESRTGLKYSLDVSLFERLVQPKTNLVQPLPFSTLNVQRRMHPSISQLVRRTIYPSLTDAPSVAEYPQVTGMKHRLFFMHHDSPEDDEKDAQSVSHTNSFECDMVAALMSHLVKQGVYNPEDIAVITPYLGQLRKLRKKLSSSFEIVLNDRDQDDLAKDGEDDLAGDTSTALPARTQVARGTLLQALRIASVDSFQGDEAKVIVISLVRSNKKNSPGFLRTTNRINVLLSRAKHGMYLIGNSQTMQNVKMWADVMDIFKEDGMLGTSLQLSCPRHPDTPLLVQKPEDFAIVAPEAGCALPCDDRLPCGHACYSKCHSEMLHNAVYCMETCTRPKPGCSHVCPNPCGAACPRVCEVEIMGIKVKPPSCDHEKMSLPCWQYQSPSKIDCDVPVQQKVIPCGHTVEVECWMDVNARNFRCKAKCGAILPCGHICKRACSECRTTTEDSDGEQLVHTDHGTCDQLCDRNYTTCRHRDRTPCHGDKGCPPCKAGCEVRCSHSRCGKKCFEPCVPCAEAVCDTPGCSMPCAAPCNSLPASTRCDKTLACGCRCPGVSGEKCPEADFCQKCGTEDNLGQIVDFIIQEEFKDIDLDENPCIFTSCGHAFTIETLDGWMSMGDYYEADPLTGQFTGIKSSVEPFSSDEMKVCPSCRGPLRDIARYGRIVRRAMLDESAKKFTVWSNARYQDFSERMVTAQEGLLSNIGAARRSNKVDQVFKLVGNSKNQLEALRKLRTTDRYTKVTIVLKEIREFVEKLRKEEQPYQRVKDLVETARRLSQRSNIEQFEVNSSELQLREHLQGVGLLIRCEIIILADVINVHRHATTRSGRSALEVEFSANRKLCAQLIQDAHSAMSVRQEAEGHIFWARLAALEYGASGNAMDEENEDTLPHLDALNKAALEHLDDAQAVCKKLPEMTEDLYDETKEVRRMLNEGTSESEMRMVVAAMAREFSGTGHWYRCANGHPFTVGECGMPMQLARCPACGAGVGGQGHVPTAGVQHAHDIEQRFGAMELDD